MGAVVIGDIKTRVQVGGDRSRKARDDLLAGDKSVPFIVSRGSSGIPIIIPPVAATCKDSALILCPVNGDSLARDVALCVEVIPGDRDQDDTVANKEGLVSVLDLNPLEFVRIRAGSISEGIIRHAAGHLRDVSVSAVPACGVIRPPGLCWALEDRAVVVEAAELDGSEILRHKESLLPF